MLDNIAFYTMDNMWRGILTDLGATGTDFMSADIIIDAGWAAVDLPMSMSELKEKILADIDCANSEIICAVFGRNADLPPVQMKIIRALSRAGADGLSAGDLRRVLGYSTDANTHAADTAIYNLRRAFGADVIRSENGKYKL
ncbi:MAG: hypothetical protein FWF34_02635 [Alphaproteobacteria bacterium]|nr:hypothetical protein [Alphaproteobacteria bacterium]MCL2890128.1 hypothetical protein [Alphaproteobacteria bacterium]